MTDQFFGKPFWIVLGGLAATFLLSLFLFQTIFAFPFLLFAAVGAARATWKRPEYGILIAFAELFANAHGHLISATISGFSFSLRMAIFCGVMSGYLGLLVFKKIKFPLRDRRLRAFFPLFAGIIIGFLIGFLKHPAIEAFKDGNAYVYLAYVFPILSIQWTSARKRLLLQTLSAASGWVVLLSIGLLFVFTHLSNEALSPIYTFVRDTRTGELTRMSGGLFRIFLQAQFSVAVSIVIISIFAWLSSFSFFRPRSRVFLFLGTSAALFSVIFISLSRSFWLALLVTAVVTIFVIFFRERPRWRHSTETGGWIFLSMVLGAAFLAGIVLIPPRSVSYQGLSSIFSERAAVSGDVALSSRWNLLSPLMREIREAPILGKGFGESVTFLTDDPRARAVFPDGTWTTTAFEWGWLDVWLKTGLLGMVGFFILFCVMAAGLWPEKRSPQTWIGYAAIATIFMLYLTNIFTPYLNHPLGLGLLLFWIPFWKQKTAILVFSESAVLEPVVQTNVVPAMSACPRMNLAASVGKDPSA